MYVAAMFPFLCAIFYFHHKFDLHILTFDFDLPYLLKFFLLLILDSKKKKEVCLFLFFYFYHYRKRIRVYTACVSVTPFVFRLL